MPTQIDVPKEVRDEIVAHALDDRPNECCGMVGLKEGALTRSHRATNAFASPVRFEITGQELFDLTMEIEERGEVVALYHSHPASEATPSQTDVNLAAQRFPGLWLIVGLRDPGNPEFRGFLIDAGGVEEVELKIAG